MADSDRINNVLCPQWKLSAGMVIHILGIKATCDIDSNSDITLTAALGAADAGNYLFDQARRGDLYFLVNGRDYYFAHHQSAPSPSSHPYIELSCSIPSAGFEEGCSMRISLMVTTTTGELASLVEDWEMIPFKQANGWGLELAPHAKSPESNATVCKNATAPFSSWNNAALSTPNYRSHDTAGHELTRSSRRSSPNADASPWTELGSLDNRPYYHPVSSAAMQRYFHGLEALTPPSPPLPSWVDIRLEPPAPALAPATQGEESERAWGADPYIAQRFGTSNRLRHLPRRRSRSDNSNTSKSTVSDNDSGIDLRSVRDTSPHDDLSKRRLALSKQRRPCGTPKKVFHCSFCAGEFTREDNLRRHQKTAHGHKKQESLKPPGSQNIEEPYDEGTVIPPIPRIKKVRNERDEETLSFIDFPSATTSAWNDSEAVPDSGAQCNLDVPLFQESPQSQFSAIPRDPNAAPRKESPFSDCGISEEFGGKWNFQTFGVDYVPNWGSNTPIDSDDLGYLYRPSKSSSTGVQYEALQDSAHIHLPARAVTDGDRFLSLRLSNVDIPSPPSARSSPNEPISPFSTSPTTPESGGGSCAADLQSSSSGINSSVGDWIKSIDSRPESDCGPTSFSAENQPMEHCKTPSECSAPKGRRPFIAHTPPSGDSAYESLAPDGSSEVPTSAGDIPMIHEFQCAPEPVLRTPFEQPERGGETINLNLSANASERRLSTSTISSMPLDSTSSKTDTGTTGTTPQTAGTTPQTTPAPQPVGYSQQITLPPNVYNPSSSPAQVWLHVLLPWISRNSQRILGSANPGGIEYLVIEGTRTVCVTAQDSTKVDKDFLETGIRSLCDQYYNDHNISVEFEVNIESGNVQRTGDHNAPRECPWPANNGHFQQVPSCGACIGMGNDKTASLGGLIELEFGHGWEVFGLTCHHMLEDNIEGETGPGVKNGFLRGERINPTFQPSQQQQEYRTLLLNRERATWRLLLDDEDEDYVSSEVKPRLAMIEAKLNQPESNTLFGRVIHSSGFDRKTEDGQMLDYALIGDIISHRLNSANYVERPSDHFYTQPDQPITKIVKKRFFEHLLKSGCSDRPTPDVTPPEPFTRVYGVGAVTGAQGGYLSTMPFFVNFEGFGEGSTEWSFAPYTPNGLGKSGDSGAWIFDSFGNVMGMILGHNGRTGITYFTPMHCIFEDIKKFTGATNVRLRQSNLRQQSVPRDVQQFQALRGTGGASTTPQESCDGPWTPFSSNLRPIPIFPPEILRTPGNSTPVSQGGDSAIGTFDYPSNSSFPPTTPCPEKRRLPQESCAGRLPKRPRQQPQYERSPCGDSAVGDSSLEEED